MSPKSTSSTHALQPSGSEATTSIRRLQRVLENIPTGKRRALNQSFRYGTMTTRRSADSMQSSIQQYLEAMYAAPNPDFSSGAGPLGFLALARQSIRGHHHLAILFRTAYAGATALTLAAALPSPCRSGSAAQAAAKVLLYNLEEGQAERGRLAAAGLRGNHDVSAPQDERDGLVLRRDKGKTCVDGRKQQRLPRLSLFWRTFLLLIGKGGQYQTI